MNPRLADKPPENNFEGEGKNVRNFPIMWGRTCSRNPGPEGSSRLGGVSAALSESAAWTCRFAVVRLVPLAEPAEGRSKLWCSGDSPACPTLMTHWDYGFVIESERWRYGHGKL